MERWMRHKKRRAECKYLGARVIFELSPTGDGLIGGVNPL